MKNLLKELLPKKLKKLITSIRGYYSWSKRNYASPSPGLVKKKVLLRHNLPNCTWIETGTYLGDTTLFLSKLSSKVISIEPFEKLYQQAFKKFKNIPNIEVINKTSEESIYDVLSKLTGNVCIYLDGHYSGDGTHLSTIETPIEIETDAIGLLKNNFDNLVVLIDDFRLFSVDPAYPKKEYLVEWAIKNGLEWLVEHDIFIASSNAL